MAEQKTEEKYMQFQLLQQHLEQIGQHMEKLQEQLQEIDNIIAALQELGRSKPDTEILAPIANGIFLKAKLLDTEKLTVNLGSDIAAEKPISEVIVLLQEQKNKITSNAEEAEGVFQQLQQQSREIYNQVREEADKN